MKKQYIIPIFVPHLGCPNDCIFCNQKSISGQKKKMTKEEAKKYLASKLSNQNLDYDAILSEINYQKYGFRNINKVINKYNFKINN